MTHRAEAGQAASLASLPQNPHAPVPLPSPTQAGPVLGTSSLLLMKWAGGILGVFPVVTDESPHMLTQPQGSPQAGLGSHFQPHLLMTSHMPRALTEVKRAPFLLENASRGSSPQYVWQLSDWRPGFCQNHEKPHTLCMAFAFLIFLKFLS